MDARTYRPVFDQFHHGLILHYEEIMGDELMDVSIQAIAAAFGATGDRIAQDLDVLLQSLDGSRGADQERIAKVGLHIAATLLRKNRDYGSSVFAVPVLAPECTPAVGIRVRASDKVKRIRQLIESGEAEVPESIDDSFTDLGGYSILYLARPDGYNPYPADREPMQPPGGDVGVLIPKPAPETVVECEECGEDPPGSVSVTLMDEEAASFATLLRNYAGMDETLGELTGRLPQDHSLVAAIRSEYFRRFQATPATTVADLLELLTSEESGA